MKIVNQLTRDGMHPAPGIRESKVGEQIRMLRLADVCRVEVWSPKQKRDRERAEREKAESRLGKPLRLIPFAFMARVIRTWAGCRWGMSSR